MESHHNYLTERALLVIGTGLGLENGGRNEMFRRGDWSVRQSTEVRDEATSGDFGGQKRILKNAFWWALRRCFESCVSGKADWN